MIRDFMMVLIISIAIKVFLKVFGIIKNKSTVNVSLSGEDGQTSSYNVDDDFDGAINLKDSQDRILCSVEFSFFETGDDGAISLTPNEDIKFRIKVSNQLSAENMQVLINQEPIDHISYSSFKNEFNYSYFLEGGAAFSIKILGLSYDLKRIAK